jgi:uncharacterized RDD family membrane protein YckC
MVRPRAKGDRVKSELRIRTPEGIVFAYSLAGPVTRAVAAAVDVVCVIAVSSVTGRLLQIGALISADFAQAVIIVSYFAIAVGYAIACEWFWRGQTVGKRLLRLRVMNATGLRLQFHQVMMRNLLRPVDMLPAFYLVGGVVMICNSRAQRLGDLAADTIVVRVTQASEPDLDQLLAGKFNSLRQHPHLEARLRQQVSPEEARLALHALVRRDEFDPVARVELFADLAAHFRSLVNFPPESVEAVPDEQYVRNVVDVVFRPRGSGSRETARHG